MKVEPFWEKISKELLSIKNKNRFRETKTYSGIDFCSNDYLGLASNLKLWEYAESFNYIDRIGSTASRLVRGNSQELLQFESSFSNFVESEVSLVVNTGYAANSGLIDAIANPQTIVFSDRLNHASILDGIRISGAIKKYYNHLDLNHLEALLQKSLASEKEKDKLRIVVTETLFSMDGDIPDLRRLLQLKKRYGFVLILDEAHSFGLFGNRGKGLVFDQLDSEEIKSIEYRVYTLGKSLGLFGGIIATSKLGRDHLVNVMRPFIFSTSLPPFIPYLATFALDLLSKMDLERKNTLELASFFKKQINEIGYKTTDSVSQIIPVLMDSEADALATAEILQSKGFDIRAIRPPTVETARLRISFNAKIKTNQVDELLGIFRQIKESH